MDDFLRRDYRESEPEWLNMAEETDNPTVRRKFLRGFLGSRIVYYPGAGEDGHPVKLFNRAHAAHSYIYADYGYSRHEVHSIVTPHPQSSRRGFRGYRIVTVLDVQREELAPWPPRYHLNPEEAPNQSELIGSRSPFALLYVFQRLPEFGEDHGAHRFAVLFLCADGFAAYDALFCQPESIARPFCVLIQDYSIFGGNWGRFGRDGQLEQIARRTNVLPELLLVAYTESEPWHGYVPITEGRFTLVPELGGFTLRPRLLYRRTPNLAAEEATARYIIPPPVDPSGRSTWPFFFWPGFLWDADFWRPKGRTDEDPWLGQGGECQ
ncbi:MAG: hypothetical protein RMK57_16810 [Bryobacterales bacterium]|nr:hypothetical protein [Bryobacteraceae bacterium]MDW8356182.1 hypothetical protein [Bryobacterales bacterium]